jgi:hypothetical protein
MSACFCKHLRVESQGGHFSNKIVPDCCIGAGAKRVSNFGNRADMFECAFR